MGSKKEESNSHSKNEIQASITGNVTNANVILAGGDVYFSKPEPALSKLLEDALQALLDNEYKRAEEFCNQILQKDHLHPKANLLSAIAALNGNGTEKMTSTGISLVESRLMHASKHKDTRPTAIAVLGIIKHDHYVVNGIFEGTPTLVQIIEEIKSLNSESIESDLIKKIKTNKITLMKIGLSL